MRARIIVLILGTIIIALTLLAALISRNPSPLPSLNTTSEQTAVTPADIKRP